MLSISTLVVAVALGQTCRMTPNGMVCSSPAQSMTMSPQSFGYGDPYGMASPWQPVSQPAYSARPIPTDVVREPFALDGSYVVPGSVRLVAAPVRKAAPAKAAASARGALAERRPYATPDEPENLSGEQLQELLDRVRVLERRATQAPPPTAVPEKAPAVPQDESASEVRPPVGQLGPGSTKGIVPLPSGDVARLPGDPGGHVTGIKPGNAPSKVVTKNGQRLPDFATSGMLWTPKQKEGYQGSPHQESHALIESLQVPEAPVPTLIDDSGKLRVTIISTNPEDRKQAVEDFKRGNGPLASVKDTYLVRATSPDRWDVKTVGLTNEALAEGKPSVVIQEPSGRVVYASTKHAPEKSAEALRKANPNFDPNKVPGMGSGLGFPTLTSQHWWLIGGAAVIAVLALVKPNQQVVA